MSYKSIPDQSFVAAGVSSVYHPETEEGEDDEDEAATVKYMVMPHQFFISQQLFS